MMPTLAAITITEQLVILQKNYIALKYKVQALMKVGYVSFDFGKIGGLNVTSSPLPNHPRPKIIFLTEDLAKGVKTQVNDVKTPMKIIHETLVQGKFFQPKEAKVMKEEGQSEELCNHYCKYHANLSGHTIQDCAEFRGIV